MKKIIVLSLALALTPRTLFAYGTGVSTMPLEKEKHHLSTEFTGITSTGGGVGFQARYTRRIKSDMTFDGGVGFGSGDQAGRVFAGLDYEIFPDYGNQPRTSLRLNYTNAKIDESNRNIISLAPTLSKSWSYQGQELFPFISLPLGFSLNNDTDTFENIISLNAGINGKLPWEGYRHITGSIEGIVGVRNNFTGMFVSLTFPVTK